MYDAFASVAETVLQETTTLQSPWRIVDGSDIRYSSLTVGQHILDKIKTHIETQKLEQSIPERTQSPQIIHGNQPKILDSLDLSQELDKLF